MLFVIGLIIGFGIGFFLAVIGQYNIEKEAEKTKRIKVNGKSYKLEED